MVSQTVACRQHWTLYTCQIRFSDTPAGASRSVRRDSELDPPFDCAGTLHSVENSLISLSRNHNVQNVKGEPAGRGALFLFFSRCDEIRRFRWPSHLLHPPPSPRTQRCSILSSDSPYPCLGRRVATVNIRRETYLVGDKPAFDFSRSSAHRRCSSTIIAPFREYFRDDNQQRHTRRDEDTRVADKARQSCLRDQ